MNLWIWLLIGLLVFAPPGSSEKSGRLDVRALALLLCVISLVAQP